MIEMRYGVRQERGGFWTVVDEMTGLPAASDGRDLTGLEKQDARDIADALNRDERSQRGSSLV